MPDHASDRSELSFLDLPEIWRPESPAIGEIFAAIPATVGVPGVHLFWRLLANFPELLEEAWTPLAAAFSSRAMARGADELRQASVIDEAVGLPSHKAFRGDLVRAEIDADFRGKISNFNDLTQFALPRLLIAVAALESPSTLESLREVAPQAPLRTPPDPVYVPPLREGEARGKAAEVLERVRAEHGLALLDDYYRSLGRIPDYLAAAWNAIRPLTGDAEYRERASAVAELATAWVARLPAPVDVASASARLAQPRADQLRSLLLYFTHVLLPQTLLDVTLIKALTEGPDRATAIPLAGS